MPHGGEITPVLAEYREALGECRRLYVDAGRTIVDEFPHLIRGGGAAFIQKMDDLHKALLIKTYILICEADRRWSANEQLLAEILFEHVWNRSLAGDALREAIREVASQSSSLQWYALVRPFDQVAPLRDRVGALETVILRVANIVAHADGKPKPSEAARVTYLQNEIQTHLRRVPIDEPSEHAAADSLGGQAIATVSQKAKTVRAQCKLDTVDLPVEEKKSNETLLQEALAELDALIGLDSVKDEVRTLINFLKIQRARERSDLPRTPLSLHMVFAGNPGTGKTTVARIVGKVFGAMGVLRSGHVVETDRSGLVAEYAGQTGPKANKKIDEAIDGVLFIDEAYSLVAASGDDPFGAEAVQTILKRMEDDRERLIIILAGYPDEMSTLLASNPGLSSRFSRQLHFEDYPPKELCRIFHRMCNVNKYEMPRLVRVKLLLGLNWLYENRDRHFGNGRMVRNVFEHAVRRLANRIALIEALTKEHLTHLHPEDIDFDGPSVRGSSGKNGDTSARAAFVQLLSHIDDDERPFDMQCPNCGNTRRLPQKYLCRRLVCGKCDEQFIAEWAAVV